MNMNNLNTLIDRLKQCKHKTSTAFPGNDRSFNMLRNYFECGSPACIAGHCAQLAGKGDERASDSHITQWLECDPRLSSWLFVGRFSPNSLNTITPEEAVAYLEEQREQHE